MPGGFIDPTPSVEEFASGLAFAERIGDVTHLIFFVNSIAPPELGGGITARLTRRLIVPNGDVERMIRMLIDAVQGVAACQPKAAQPHH